MKHTHTFWHTLMWSATPIASQNWLSKPQTKFGVHWPKPRGQKKGKEENWGEQQRKEEKKSVTTEWSLTTYDSSLASAHPAYTLHSFTGMYMHTSPGARGTELDFGKPCFLSLVPSGCCCMAAGQADGPRSSPFSLLSFLFFLSSVPTDPPTKQLPSAQPGDR